MAAGLVVAVVFYVRHQELLAKSRKNCCLSDRMLIDGAKIAFAEQTGATNGAPVSAKDILPYLPASWTTDMVANGTCLDKGVFTLGLIGEDPKCSVHGRLTNK